MRRYKVGKVLKMLRREGWVVVRCRGDHRQQKNTKGQYLETSRMEIELWVK